MSAHSEAMFLRQLQKDADRLHRRYGSEKVRHPKCKVCGADKYEDEPHSACQDCQGVIDNIHAAHKGNRGVHDKFEQMPGRDARIERYRRRAAELKKQHNPRASIFDTTIDTDVINLKESA